MNKDTQSKLARLGIRLEQGDDGAPVLKNIVPVNPRALLRRGSELCLMKNHSEGIRFLEEAAKAESCRKTAVINLANAYLDLMAYDRAIFYAKESLKFDNEDPFVHQTLFKIYVRIGEITKAEKHLVIAQCLEPDSETTTQLAMERLAYKNCFNEYFKTYAQHQSACLLVGKGPFSTNIINSLNNVNLQELGDLFQISEEVINDPVFIYRYGFLDNIGYEYWEYRQRAWRGEDLNGKTLLVYSEQGLGDNLWLLRVIRSIKEKYDCRIVFATYRSLHKVIERCEYIDRVLCPVFDIEELASADYIASNFNLLEFVSCEDKGPHLPVFDHVKLPQSNKQKVIVNWISKVNLAHVKQIDLNILGDILRKNQKKYDYFVCQHEKECERVQEDIKKYDYPIKECIFSQNVEDLFAYIQDSDLVVSVDTLHIHAAGGLGKRAIVLLMCDITLPFWGSGLTRVPHYNTLYLSRNISSWLMKELG